MDLVVIGAGPTTIGAGDMALIGADMEHTGEAMANTIPIGTIAIIGTILIERKFINDPFPL